MSDQQTWSKEGKDK